LELELINKL